jgi:hypothetical protein
MPASQDAPAVLPPIAPPVLALIACALLAMLVYVKPLLATTAVTVRLGPGGVGIGVHSVFPGWSPWRKVWETLLSQSRALTFSSYQIFLALLQQLV